MNNLFKPNPAESAMAKLIDLISKDEYEIEKTVALPKAPPKILIIGSIRDKGYYSFPYLIDRSHKDYRWNIINPSKMSVRIDWTENSNGRTESKKLHIKGQAPSFHLLDGDIIRIDYEDRKEGIWRYNFLYKI